MGNYRGFGDFFVKVFSGVILVSKVYPLRPNTLED